ncbi:MAG: hypothetical protein Q4E54_01260 [Lachnospiraceae bacterium]|nr:hypothetical protein [Lachnospiraceae bacterium]
MKRIKVTLLISVIIAVLTGCGDNSASKSQSASANSVSSVMQQQMNQTDTEQQPEQNAETQQSTQDSEMLQAVNSEVTTAEKKTTGTSDVDVDLTALSSTMVYSEVYNMLDLPEDYTGKTVRMNGQFALYQAYDENGEPVPDQIYYACVIADATACCQQGLEFVLAGNYTYPDDYPELGSEITVVGEFQTYMEDDYQYCHLIDAHFD